MRIIVIESDPTICDFVREIASKQNWTCEVCNTAAAGEEAALTGRHDLVVIGHASSDQSYVAACVDLRQAGVSAPIIALTANDATNQRIAAYDAGANACLTTPFASQEFIALSLALQRRYELSRLRYADVEMDCITRAVSRAGLPIKLRNKELELLEFFMRRPDRVLQRAVIAEHVWDMNHDLGSNVIDVYVAALRRKLDKDFAKRLIHNVIGVGYFFGTDPPING